MLWGEPGLYFRTSDDSIPSLPVAVEEESKPTPDAAIVLRILLLLLLLPSQNNFVAKPLPGCVDEIPRPLVVVFLCVDRFPCPLVVAVVLIGSSVVGLSLSFNFLGAGDFDEGDCCGCWGGSFFDVLLPVPATVLVVGEFGVVATGGLRFLFFFIADCAAPALFLFH